MGTQVMPATRSRFGAGAAKLRLTRSGGWLAAAAGMVVRAPAAPHPAQAPLPHQPPGRAPGRGYALAAQLQPDLARPVDLVAVLPDAPDLGGELRVAHRPG